MAWTSASEPAAPAGAPGGAPAPATWLEVVHDTRYRYGSSVSLAHHLAHLRPLADAHQRLHAFALEVDPAPAHRRESTDALGNAQCHFSLQAPHLRLHVRAASVVELVPRFAGLAPEGGPAWEQGVDSLRYVARKPFEPALGFAQPSPFVPRLAELKAWAAPSFAAGRPVAAVALELMHRIHVEFEYRSQSTEVDTPLAEAFAQRRGVCQDFAHLLAGSLRAWGLPARYVSGYLLTHPPDGGHALLGADASHAWVQAWCPGTPGVPAEGPGAGWLDLDPTNDLVPGSGHVRLAIGRDFGDVTPLRGVIRGGGRHDLEVAVRTRILQPPGPDLAQSHRTGETTP
jgi:transglutaminase-like putative cysteine protease